MLINFSVTNIPDSVNLEELYLLDTSVLGAFAVPERQLADYKNSDRRYSESRIKIRNAILSGNFRSGVITPAVYQEVEGVCRHRKYEDKRTYENNIAQLKNNSDCRIYEIGIPRSIFAKLPDDIQKQLDRGARTTVATSMTARIPNIVTDDDAVFSLQKRLKKIYEKKRVDEKRLEIMDSNCFVFSRKL